MNIFSNYDFYLYYLCKYEFIPEVNKNKSYKRNLTEAGNYKFVVNEFELPFKLGSRRGNGKW